MNTTSSLRAALPMYDWPEVTEANDKLWALIAEELCSTGLNAPENLSRDIPYHALWCEPDCVFSQTCSRPFVDGVDQHVFALATPIYAATGCQGIFNASQIVCRKDDPRQTVPDFRNATAVCNTEDSQSGYHSLRAYMVEKDLPAPFFGKAVMSGGHRQSVKMIAEGSADIGAIDPVSWELASRFEPESVQYLRVIDQTPQVPGLPYIINKQLISEEQAETLTQTLIDILTNLPESLKSQLKIIGAAKAKPEEYEFVRQLDSHAAAAGHVKFT